MISPGKYQQFTIYSELFHCYCICVPETRGQLIFSMSYQISSQCKKEPQNKQKKASKNICGNCGKGSSFPSRYFPVHFNVASKMLQPLAMLVFCTSFFPLISPFCYIPLGQINSSSSIPYTLSTPLVHLVLWGYTQHLSLYATFLCSCRTCENHPRQLLKTPSVNRVLSQYHQVSTKMGYRMFNFLGYLHFH